MTKVHVILVQTIRIRSTGRGLDRVDTAGGSKVERVLTTVVAQYAIGRSPAQ